jgi:hypothetical protein
MGNKPIPLPERRVGVQLASGTTFLCSVSEGERVRTFWLKNSDSVKPFSFHDLAGSLISVSPHEVAYVWDSTPETRAGDKAIALALSDDEEPGK